MVKIEVLLFEVVFELSAWFFAWFRPRTCTYLE
jgi:hypothetical protein